MRRKKPNGEDIDAESELDRLKELAKRLVDDRSMLGKRIFEMNK
jgi:hypothetical protein